jgi:hypothetical protein
MLVLVLSVRLSTLNLLFWLLALCVGASVLLRCHIPNKPLVMAIACATGL